MGDTVLVLTVLTFALATNFLLMAATEIDISTEVHQTNRTSKEIQEKTRMIQDPINMLKTNGRKLSSDDYNTFSSLTSDIIVETSSSPTNSKIYPSLTTRSPTFITRGRFIRNPFYFSRDDQEMEFEDDQHSDLSLNGGLPKWNRFNMNHRQLNKYGPSPLEADITVDEDGSTGYGSTFDFGGGGGGSGGIGSSYDSGSYRNPGNGWAGGDGMVGWFSEPIGQSSRPVPIIAEIRHPSNQKMSMDLTKIGIVALIKIAIAKLKALGFIKAMLLVVFKLKLIIIMTIIKFLMLVKFLKLSLILPILLTIPTFLLRLFRLNALLNPSVLVPNNLSQNNGMDTNNDGDDGTTVRKRRTTPYSGFTPLEILNPEMKEVIRSEKCLERASCRMAGAKRPSLTLIGLNWAVSPISKYIPSKKLRTFVSTFSEVTNYRLDNLYNSLLPTDWTKWCNDHYTCAEAKNKI